MRLNAMRAAMLGAATISLGGCSSFLGIHFAHHEKPAKAQPGAASPAELASAGAPATEAGRQQLAEGRIGLAVASFQQALGSGEPAAPAFNGMGVAYARLGRFDVAQRMFERAMAEDPSDSRYAENMTRLMRSSALAMRRDADIAAKAQAQLAADTSRPPAPTIVANGQIQRLSRGEVRIVTAPSEGPAPAKATARAAARPFKPLIRIAFADKEAEAGGFVRIVLPEADKRKR